MTNDATPTDIAVIMACILGTMLLIIAGLVLIQSPSRTKPGTKLLACRRQEPSKRAYESWVALYTPIWILAFAAIVGFKMYETFSAASYMIVCVGLALPFLLQPILFPSAGFDSPDQHRPLRQRYSFKANIWLAVYSFIGNYYYTHYFYSVLKAEYTMPAHRLNNVPIALFFATHFYFSTYHLFSNIMLRWVETSFAPTARRKVLFWAVVVVFSYFTAFMETLTISSYPDYSFQDRDAAYTLGSAFYGIYFLVSFPAFYNFDRNVDDDTKQIENGLAGGYNDGGGDADNANSSRTGNTKAMTVWDTIVSSCGYGMIILTLLDFVRLKLGIPLVMDVSGGSQNACSATSKYQ
jgi:cycloeucalenol cycloisomerase